MSGDRPSSELISDDFQPAPRWRLRGYVMFLPAMLCVVISLTLLLLMALIVPKLTRKWEIPLIRAWGRLPLSLFGIRIEVHNQERRTAPGAKILLFNHINIFDLLVLAATWTKGSSVVYKKEFHRIPIMGRMLRFFDMIAIDRQNRETAFKNLAAAASQIRDHQNTVVMAPEGTRSTTGKVSSFKKGPFHLALQTKVPVVPMIMRGLEVLAPGGTLFPHSGLVRIDYLEEISTEDWDRSNLSSQMTEVRRRFLQYLPDGLADE